MKTLDRYIIRHFAINFGILLSVIVILFVLIDLIIDLDEFLESGKTWVEAGIFKSQILATLWVIWDYDYPMILLIIVFMSGLLVVASAAFTFVGFSRTGELVAMVTSGISMHRIAAPVVVAGCIISAAMLPLQEFVIAPLAPKLIRSKTQTRYGKLQSIGIGYARDNNHALLSASEFDYKADDSVLGRVSILERTADGVPTRRIVADQAVWNVERQGWELIGGYARDMNNQVVAPGLNAAVAVNFFATNLTPEVLQAHRAANYQALLSFSELSKLSQNPSMDGRALQQIIHSRFSLVVMNVLVLVMALPFFLLREPRGAIAHGLRAAIVSTATFFGGFLLMQFGFEHLNPLAAAWLPVVIFLPVSAGVLQMTKT